MVKDSHRSMFIYLFNVFQKLISFIWDGECWTADNFGVSEWLLEPWMILETGPLKFERAQGKIF